MGRKILSERVALVEGLHGCMAEIKLKRPFLGYCGFVANHSYVERSGRYQQGSQADTKIKDKGEA